MKKTVKMELLAPAGNIEIAKAALNAGADSVYLGGLCSARAYAKNLSLDEIKEISDYAHERDKKIYVTVNTMLLERELEEALRFTEDIWEKGADAIIAADLGYISMIHFAHPEIEIHASTQMGISVPETVELLKRYGVKRAVAARECSLRMIKELKAEGIEIETFCHGAMCSGISGACLMSGAISERSGNRGRCSQVCRQYFTGDHGQGYLLSMKDLCTLELLDQFKETGIDCLKIEGRMKSLEYVVTTTAAYRRAIDALYRGDSVSKGRLTDDLKTVFNRGGFSDGYYKTRDQKTFPDRQGHMGLEIGTVRIFGGRPGFTYAGELENGDDLEISGKGIKGKDLSRRGNVYTLGPEYSKTVGEKVFLKSSERIRKEAEMLAKDDFRRPVDIDLYLYDGKAVLKASSGDISVSVERTTDRTANKEPDASFYEKQLRKTGGTVFDCNKVMIHPFGSPFFSSAEINEMRRSALTGLLEKIAPKRTSLEREIPKPRHGFMESTADPYVAYQVSSLKNIRFLSSLGKTRIYFSPSSREELDGFLEDASISAWLVLPSFISEGTRELICGLEDMQRKRIEGLLCRNISSVALAKSSGLPFVADYLFNTANSMTSGELYDLGASSVTLSEEISLKDMGYVAGPSNEVVVYGNVPIMELYHDMGIGRENIDRGYSGEICTDRGNAFPVDSMFVGESCIEISNGVKKCFTGFSELKKAGIRGIRLILTDEGEEEITCLSKAYEDSWLNGMAFDMRVRPKTFTNGRLPRGVE